MTSEAASPGASGTPIPTFHVGDTVRWCWTGDNATGQWFTACLTAYRPGEFPVGWAGELVDPGTFYGGPDPDWTLGPGETVYLDEPSMTPIEV